MKTVVLYKSISGFTRTYAEWVAEELQADIFGVERVTDSVFESFDVIVFGGSLHAVGINGVDILKKNFAKLLGKKVVVFAVGASPEKEGIPAEVLNKNFSEEQQKHIKFFYLRGGFNFSKLDFPNKILMTLFKWRLKTKREKTSDEEGMLEAYDQPLDCTKKENLKALIEYVRSLG